MKAIIIYVGNIMHCPPALSVAKTVDNLGVNSILCTIGIDEKEIVYSLGNLSHTIIRLVEKEYQNDISLFEKFIRMERIKKSIWRVIDENYDDETVIWIIGEETVKHVGERITTKRYILHLLELNEGLYYISGNPIFKLDHKKLAQNASVVIEAEYNRAHITKAWWELKELPFVLPNKPYIKSIINPKSEITVNEQAKELIDRTGNKKIILYQGNISAERPLDRYIKAVDMLGEEYAFVMMINGANPYKDINATNFYCLPFIVPPHHLEITSWAYVGILSYTPIKNSYSILNTLYCAPNKIWEYSMFGLPMISSDLPALRDMFNSYNNGICLSEVDSDSIAKAIVTIDEHYSDYKKASLEFFDSIDINEKVKEVLQQAFGKR